MTPPTFTRIGPAAYAETLGPVWTRGRTRSHRTKPYRTCVNCNQQVRRGDSVYRSNKPYDNRLICAPCMELPKLTRFSLFHRRAI